MADLHLAASPTAAHRRSGPWRRGAGFPTGPQTGYSIEVVNRGEQSVRVSSVGFDLADGQQLVLFPNEINDLPGTVNAGDAASAFAAKDKLPPDVVMRFAPSAAGQLPRSECGGHERARVAHGWMV